MAGSVMVSMVRAETTKIGFTELRTASEVEDNFKLPGLSLVFVNSMCGCAGGAARPAVAMALQDTKKRPNNLFTVFAGQDLEATEKARTYFTGYPPSSPSFAFLRDGRIVSMIERHQIEGKVADKLAVEIKSLLESFE